MSNSIRELTPAEMNAVSGGGGNAAALLQAAASICRSNPHFEGSITVSSAIGGNLGVNGSAVDGAAEAGGSVGASRAGSTTITIDCDGRDDDSDSKSSDESQ
jgi:hypothetical protein